LTSETVASGTNPPAGDRGLPRGPLTLLAGLVLVLLAALLLREAAPVIVPVLFGLFLALVAWPLIPWLQRKGIGRGWAIGLSIALIVALVIGTFAILVASVAELVKESPRYGERLSAEIEAILAFLQGLGFTIDTESLLENLSPAAIAGAIRSVASGVSEAGIALFVAVVAMLYGLAAAGSLQTRARQAFGEGHALLSGVEQFGVDLRRYLWVRALLGLFAAALIFVVLLVLSVPLPALWAFLVFAASFIPNIGTLIALVPTTILAFLDGGLGVAIAVVVAYTFINFIQDHFLQPVIMGSELNLTPLVVFVAVVGWAWIFGAPGALLAVPLTVGLVAIMEAFPQSRPWATLLRNKAEPPATGDPELDPFTSPLED
jgi:predicted PurR-regulated permease PerM